MDIERTWEGMGPCMGLCEWCLSVGMALVVLSGACALIQHLGRMLG